jgi:endonuclease III
VKAARARALWNAGFKSIRAIASAKHEDIMRSVKLGPFAERSAKLIIANAKKLLERKAEELRKTAAELLAQ